MKRTTTALLLLIASLALCAGAWFAPGVWLVLPVVAFPALLSILASGGEPGPRAVAGLVLSSCALVVAFAWSWVFRGASSVLPVLMLGAVAVPLFALGASFAASAGDRRRKGPRR